MKKNQIVWSFMIVAAAVSFVGQACALDNDALPSGGSVSQGSATITTCENLMTIGQQSGRVSIDWATFNIGKDAAVEFSQPSSSSIALNRIHDANPSQICGRLSANGQIFLLNSAGIIFSSTASVDVGGLVASSLNISDADFLSNKFYFAAGDLAGIVLNQGEIRTGTGGYVAFLGPSAANEGKIVAPLGTAILVAGSKVTLDFAGDSLINYTVQEGAFDALAQNHGLIKADGGLVVMTAKAKDELSKAVVNNDGIIEAQTVAQKSGRILLLSDMDNGETIVGGTLDASAPNGGDGGFIETSGHKVTLNGARITAAAPYGKAGTWLLDPTDLAIDSAYVNGTVTSTTILDPTTAFVTGWSGWVSSTGSIASSFGGANPWIDTSSNWLRFAYIDNSYVYKDFTLSGSETSISFSCQYDGFGSGSSPNDTGKIQLIFLNSSGSQVGSTVESGTLTGSGSFQTASITASSIPSGAVTVRVRFYQINEVNGWANQYGIIFCNPTVSGLGTSGGILATLNGGTNVTAQTSASGSDAGNIVVSAAIATTGTSAGALTLIAHNNITISSNISLTGTSKDLTLQAGAAIAIGGTISTVGGLVISSGGDITQSQSLAIEGATTITAGSYDITLNNNSNNFTGTVSIVSGKDISLVNAAALSLGAITASGTVSAASLSGNLTLTGAVSTSDTTSSAITINAGQNAAAGTSSGGNIIISGGSVNAGSGGQIILYSGSISGSTGLVALIGSGSGNFRYNSDETTTNYFTLLSSGTYAVYRGQPTLTVTAVDDNKTYDGLAYSGGNGVSLSGYVNGDSLAQALSGSVTYGGTAQGAVDVNTYALTPSGYTSLLGYAISYSNGTLTVNKASLSVTANDYSKTYDGLAYSGGNGAAYSGFMNGETYAVLGGALSYGGTSQGAVDVGTYSIIPSGYLSGNYDFTYNNGTLIVDPLAIVLRSVSDNEMVNMVVRSLTSMQHGLNGTQQASVRENGQTTGDTAGQYYILGPGVGSSSLGVLASTQLIIDRRLLSQ